MLLIQLATQVYAVHVKEHTKSKLCGCTLASKELLKDVKGAAIGLTALAPHTPHAALQTCFPISVATFSSSVTMSAYMMVCNETCHQVFIVCTAVYIHDRDKAVSYIAAKGSARGITVRICKARHTLGFG